MSAVRYAFDLKDKPKFEFDPTDWNAMEELMDTYGDVEYPFTGDNDKGEFVVIYVWKDRIRSVTFQKNGWARTNIYHRDDYTVEELYEK